jgi:hypothetical protein
MITPPVCVILMPGSPVIVSAPEVMVGAGAGAGGAGAAPGGGCAGLGAGAGCSGLGSAVRTAQCGQVPPQAQRPGRANACGCRRTDIARRRSAGEGVARGRGAFVALA